MFLFQYDSIRVISLPERTDRRAQMQRALRRYGAEPDFFNAIRPDNLGKFASIGFHGSYLSHLAVLSDGGSVLLLEDDCAFYPRAVSFNAPPCDIFYGSHREDSGTIIGAHCMGFSARAAKFASAYLSGLLDGSVSPDPIASAQPDYDPEILPPIDGAYVWFRRAHPELTTSFAEITYQRASRSDCTPGRLDSVPMIRSLLDVGRRAKAALA